MSKTINVEQVKQLLNVEHKARQEALKVHPATEHDVRDAPQMEILAYFTSALKDIRDGYIERLNRARTERAELTNKIDVSRAKDQFQQIGDDVESSLIELVVGREDGLKRSFEAKDRADKQLRAFKHEHNLVTTEPDYPHSMWDHMSWVLVAALLEWILLSYFYKDIGTGGWVEGFFYASLFSAVNLLIALILGNVLRQINQKNRVRKVLAGVSALILVVAFLFATILVAHFRYAGQEVAEQREKAAVAAAHGIATGSVAALVQAATALSWNSAKAIGNRAWERARQDWTDLPDPLGWIVIIATCLFGVITAWKGYGMDDPRPGYGKLDRTVRQRDEEYGEIKKDYVVRLSELYDKKLQAQNQIFREIDTNIDRFLRNCEGARAEVQQFDGKKSVVQNNCNAVLGAYRGTYWFVKGAPIPPYLDADIELDEGITQDLLKVADLLGCEARQGQYSDARREFSALVAENRRVMNEKKTSALRDYQVRLAAMQGSILTALIAA